MKFYIARFSHLFFKYVERIKTNN